MSNSLTHIAIIPDGNRRWAKNQGKASFEGHKYAADHTIPALYDVVMKLGIKYCTLWALSPENFTKRSTFEINNLLQLIHLFVYKRIDEMNKKGIKINIIGDIFAFPKNIQKDLTHAVEQTSNNTKLTFTFALNYGGRDEIVRAIKKIQNSNVDLQTITKESFSKFLDTAGMPDPELIIRTGGEKRTSGFMPWQTEYTEYAFLDTLFPDFTPQDLEECIEDFYSRQRRFGK
ncbi:MAG: polyprenyl diphosphate synthase [bacterium]|nr:polyprenyl diphosphate synthase [bacterium]